MHVHSHVRNFFTLCLMAGFALLMTACKPQDKDSAEGHWEGSYTCIQGSTRLMLTVIPAETDHYRAMFHFKALPGNQSVPEGCFTMTGVFDHTSRRLLFSPDSWIKQPPFYITVGLDGVLGATNQNYEGQITGGVSCTTFELTRPTSDADFSGMCDQLPKQ